VRKARFGSGQFHNKPLLCSLKLQKNEQNIRSKNLVGTRAEHKVLPVLVERGIAPLGMKPIGGHGEPVQHGVFTAEELLKYAMSLPVATTISSVSELPILEQNLRIAQGFVPLAVPEMQALRERAKPYAGDGHFELYKTSIKFDNPEARIAHDFPLDLQSVEVKQMIYATQNTGRPYPQVPE
jgi:uncharacterized protein